MNIVMWVLAGGILGWASCAYLRFNEARGVLISTILGAVGGLIGGKLIAPMFLTPAAADFSIPALFFAAAVAAGLLAAGNLIYNRWGV
jgi:uncharacterized membrane protein YeaQ/YmgE (transglycosylase-associated protein family)